MKTVVQILSIISALAIGAIQAIAQEWNTQPEDERLNRADLQAELKGNTLVYEGGQKSIFNSDGTYEFVVEGQTYQYYYEFTEEGEVCITSAEFGTRCDLLVLNGADYISINDKGERYKASLVQGE
ncbi:hypothetical protein [Ruegeria arenilitoris]|uniref:hypothetical protein n=1 Tax=Ruegeria arenilitoris TaxID=1173585 RepID=UPI001480DF2C|nr:hypothetical protein [Ruegeria arenilitoris]